MASLASVYKEQLEAILVPSEWSSISHDDYQQRLGDATELIDQIAIADGRIAKLQHYRQRLQDCKRHYLMALPPTKEPASSQLSSERGLALLKQARRELQESEDSGKDTINRLDQQRTQIQNTSANVRAINQQLSYSDRLLNKMSQWFR